MPYLRQMSAVAMPASCSLKMPMICSSLNRELFIIRLLRGDGLYLNLVGIMGLRSHALIGLRLRPQYAHGTAATTMTSTSIPGRQKSVVRQARAGGFAGSTHSFQTELWSSNRRMSAIQTWALSSCDLSVPARLR